MKKRKYNCPAELTLEQFAGKWKVIILWLVRKGPQRSGRIKSQLPGISGTAFSKAVRELEEAGLLERNVRQSTMPFEVTYQLTSLGSSLSPIVRSLVRWGLENKNHFSNGEFLMLSS